MEGQSSSDGRGKRDRSKAAAAAELARLVPFNVRERHTTQSTGHSKQKVAVQHVRGTPLTARVALAVLEPRAKARPLLPPRQAGKSTHDIASPSSVAMEEGEAKKDRANGPGSVGKRPSKSGHVSSASTLPSLPTGIPTDMHLALLLDKTVLSSAALLVRHWLLTGHSEELHQPQHHHTSGIDTNSQASTQDLAEGSSPFSDGFKLVPKRIASPWAIATAIFVIAALGQILWFRVWTWLPSLRRSDPQMKVLPRKIASLGVILFGIALFWLMALERLGATTVIIFSQFCDIWAGDLARSVKSRTYGSYTVVAALLLSLVCQLIFPPSGIANIPGPSFAYDDPDNPLPPSLRHTRPVHLASPSAMRAISLQAELEAKSYSPSGLLVGHLCLLAVAFLSIEKERAALRASTEAGGRRRAHVLACIVTSVPVLGLGMVAFLFGLPALPPWSSLSPSLPTTPDPFSATQEHGHLAAYALLAIALLILEPLVGAALEPHASMSARVIQGWPLAVGAVIMIGRVGFGLRVKWTEIAVLVIAGWGLRSIVKSSPVYAEDEADSNTSKHTDGTRVQISKHRRTQSEMTFKDLMASCAAFFTGAQETISVIYANDDSRKIFQFLILNLAFMVVQLVWGVSTNSLGLISDAIHMFFDCLAIGMGLLASVMKNWKNDTVFTFGYSRIETLSGFANGIFLILISIFIVFEGIDRVIHPPEMHNTRQLLIVSSMGLGVNLFGMFAMGGHHHHGHGHSHHGHDHDHGHGHGHDHAHGHSHNMMGVYLHVMADTLGSVGVIISTLLIQYFGWTGFDPIASLFIAFLIVGSVIPLVVDAGRILSLDLGDVKEQEVSLALKELHHIEGLESYSSPRFWPKDSDTIIGSISLQIKTYAAPITNGTHGSTTSSTSPSKSNGSLVESIVSPVVAPEKLVSQVEALLKKKISGLETLIIQCEAAKPASMDNHAHEEHHHNHNHSHSHSPSTKHNHPHHDHHDHHHH